MLTSVHSAFWARGSRSGAKMVAGLDIYVCNRPRSQIIKFILNVFFFKYSGLKT